MVSDIRWSLILPGGRQVDGAGQDGPNGIKLATAALDAIAARFVHPAGTVIYCAGKVSLVWTVQNIFACGDAAVGFMRSHGVKQTTKALGLTPACEACRVWLMPNGFVGIGRTVEEVELAWQAFNAQKV